MANPDELEQRRTMNRARMGDAGEIYWIALAGCYGAEMARRSLHHALLLRVETGSCHAAEIRRQLPGLQAVSAELSTLTSIEIGRSL